MKVSVFGANGPSGRLLTRALLDAGHSVVAVTRHPGDFPITDSQLTVAEADVFSRSAVAEVIAGTDAVLSTLGVGYTRQPVDTFSTGTANIVAAMVPQGIRRLIVVSSTTTHIYRDRRDTSLLARFFEFVMSRTFGRTVYDDLRRMEAIVAESDLDWTIVRPSILFDLDHPTTYIAGTVCPVGIFTARIDLAAYMSTLAGDASSIGKIVTVSTTEGAPTFWQNIKNQSSKP